MGYCEYREELDNRMLEDVYEAFVIYLEKIYLKDGADAVRLEYRQYSKEEIDAITWEIVRLKSRSAKPIWRRLRAKRLLVLIAV